MSQECSKLHELLNNKKRFAFPFNKQDIPLNGLYVLSEKGEHAHKKDRIVRIGTHTGKNQLPSRLEQHFLKENKDRSIFRKNIGRALLNKQNDSFLPLWEIDLTPKAAREKYSSSIDAAKQKQTEALVSSYIRENLSFCVIPLETKSARLELESKLISTVSLCEECSPSAAWLGNHSPKAKIRESGLWQENELYKKPMNVKKIEGLN